VENAELLKARYVEKFSSGGAAGASPPGRIHPARCRSHEALGYILSEQAEIGVTVRPVDMLEHPQLLSCGRAQRSADAVLRKDNPLTRRLEVTWDDIRTSRILLLPQSSAASRLVASVVSAQAVRFGRVLEVSLVDIALGMAAAGYGVVVLPSYVAPPCLQRCLSPHPGSLRPVPFQPAIPAGAFAFGSGEELCRPLALARSKVVNDGQK
jgi:DNA-binding transcriptional LysR family regulator